jgi:DNA polymerase III sliding clamp (beta) subunit (PCNA family)
MMVRAGLSARESLEQSSSFAFKGKEVMTFNDEVACRKSIPISLNGAVEAQKLLTMLEQTPDPFLKVIEEDRQIIFKGKRRAFGAAKEAEVSLPIDRVETPTDWKDLPDQFSEAVTSVKPCVCTDETKFVLTCIHITGEFLEACDNTQIMRHRCRMPDLKKPVLVRGDALTDLVHLKMTGMSVTKSWIHFQNEERLIYSVRKYADEYPDLAPLMKVSGEGIVIPKGLGEAADRAAIYAGDGDPILMVSIAPGVLKIKSRSGMGWYREAKTISYDGPEIEFAIRPSTLRKISEKHRDAVISQTKLKVNGGSAKEGGLFEYVTVLGIEEEEEDEKPKKSKAERDQEDDTEPRKKSKRDEPDEEQVPF